ncbi:MAG: bifunctional precorrin-2 dehydrogenase/sirohydrochlorin ferrochelatase [Aquificae bacterium]|jgi:precorrin-2 dehydrogenase/sirohydrochlorin ferrochelatase|nr:bifunctional precorrin-2 dehydrogenase/sirohydrochlorin ferrochelatase [Aquificota bacterium]
MPLFPLFVDLKGKEILVVGGGKIATRKVEKLLPFGGKITVVAPKISPELKKLSKEGKIKIKRRRFLTGDLKNKDLVVVATDDINLQRKIFKLCSKKRIPVNSVDSPDYCSFIFGSLIVRGDLVIGITTSSKAPALSKEIRKLIEKHLPPNVEEILNHLYEVRKKYPKGRKRQKLLTQMAKELINKKPDGGKDREV